MGPFSHEEVQGLSLWGVTKRYRKKTALDYINLKIDYGQVVGILGLNGSGKTTLLKSVAGLLKPNKGTVELDGRPVREIRTTQITYVPEVVSFYEWMSTDELSSFILGLKPSFDRQAFHVFLSDFGINTNERIEHLSKGQKSLIKISMGLAQPNRVLILDEPLEGIDPPKRMEVLKRIRAHTTEDTIVLISSHLVHDIESALDSVVFLNDGRLSTHQPLSDILATHGSLMNAFGEYTE